MVSKYQRIAMACQGGGALGAYHLGALKAMEEKGYSPDMIAGISIGSISAAIIAGNHRKDRVKKLEEFWDFISRPEMMVFPIWNDQTHKLHNKLSAYETILLGQPNFFSILYPGPSLSPKGSKGATSYTDTSMLRDTLLKFVDFDALNSGKLARLLLGVTRVRDGELMYFDSDKMKITPEHVMASGAMPPFLPGIEIDGELYWDGGCANNTPLESIFVAESKVPTLCFMIDLFSVKDTLPQTLDELKLKVLNIQYLSRTAHHIGHVHSRQNLAKALHHMLQYVPKGSKDDPTIKAIMEMVTDVNFDVVHIAYDKPAYEGISASVEFSRSSIKERVLHGYQDLISAIEHAAWLKERPSHVGSTIHRYVGGKYRGST